MTRSGSIDDIQLDLAILQAMVHEMQTYLLDSELFWQMDVRGRQASRFPRLTLGGLFLRRHYLRALADAGQLPPAEAQTLADVDREFEAVRQQWQVAFEKKLGQELKTRVNSWSTFLKDCQTGERNCADDWPREAEVRTMIELLLEQADDRPVPDLEAQKGRLAVLDVQLRNMFYNEGFVWDKRLEVAYPHDRFWWLYGRPHAR